MLLFVGLGNPGSKYERNRHNIGFMAVDDIVHRHNFSAGQKKWQAITFEGRIGNEKIIALQPQTFMNNSGQSVGEAMRFFKLSPGDVFVFYDELDLAFGKIKAKIGGGAAGHNGIRSITSHIGADYNRIRMGIGHPGHKDRVHGHVLGDFAKSEQTVLDDMLSATGQNSSWLTKRDLPRFMSEVALSTSPNKSNTQKHTGNKTSPTKAITPKKSKQDSKQEGPMAAMLRALKGDK
ncbi:aminoacyl-tRNA hydrolase [Kordiimonas sp. SCSIO 12610]|uniref:aminoacyl-tRNA hydrolase n=1 Tax=Kordiimonas sp. SCSIO 12610 TaxID=2829597 RepID=UPI00210B61E1|nr:aminoacyl-tRNA hydrolase [Kordiimonas sp. SCSIO 12610]UTW54977.1 aminoacyl-tRNA hydrolase [Kordiimonas sp. SCSIO 12610]